MSSFVVGEVLERSETEHGVRLVMLVLADQAHRDGISWPSQASIGKMSKLSERAVRDGIDMAVGLGELQVRQAQRGRARINVYRVLTGAVGDQDVDYDRLPFKLVEAFDDRQIPPVVPAAESDTDDRQNLPASPSTTDLDPVVDPLADHVASIYAYWRERRGKTRANYNTISDARRKKIVSRLKEFTVEQLLDAIDGVCNDPWSERRLHDDLTVIFRSREQVDRFLEFAARAPAPARRYGRGVQAAEILEHARESASGENGHVDGAGRSIFENLETGKATRTLNP